MRTCFPEATHLVGDRNHDLSLLPGGEWDATIDVNAYIPRQVRSLAEALDGRGGRQLYISTVSVYRTPVAPGFAEDAPLVELDDPTVEEVTDQTYGGLKVLCERAAIDAHGPDTTVIRPTYVIGPHDYSYRFTYWVDRIARGGEVLAPGDPTDPIQVIDARDMATWGIGLLERKAAGIFHAVSPPPPFGFGHLLDAVATEVAPAGTTLTWVDSDFLHAAGETDSSMPMWPGGDPGSDASAADPAAANATGLSPRPLRQTIKELLAAERASPTSIPTGVGLSAEREADLLNRWARR
ncbi:MAG: NAD-dependent epimerase/dehydratase family protein [Sporichthyaceae bacterium]|nr:NAD-dependent epimerase/dehydratase family protein [Sporichthyaceae bacterium]